MKTNTQFRITAVLLLSALLLAGCGSTAPDAEPKNTDAPDTTPEQTTEAPNIYAHNLGDFDFKGETFTMYTRNSIFLNDNLHCTEADGTTLNDEIYARNLRLEDQYNFKFEEIREDANTTKARTTVLAGEDAYDIIVTRCVYAFDYALEGILHPITVLPHIDLSKPYWDAELTEAVSIGGKKFFAVGAYNLSGYDFTHMLAFNKAIAAQFDYSVYNLVNNGTWTFDTMQDMMKNVTSDLDGNGVMDDKDRYGLLSTPKQIPPCFWIAADQLSIKMDSRKYPTYSMLSDEGFADVFARIFELAWDTGGWFVNKSGENVDPNQVTMFINNQSLFIDMAAFYLEDLRNMDADFGLIPFPKYDEAQKTYYSRIEGCEQTCIPVTNINNLEMTSVILEAMASDSAQHLIPAYYEILLKSKLARDNDSEQMLEIIFANRVFDWGDTIWCAEIRDGKFNQMMQNNKRDLASTAKSLEKTMRKKIDKVIEAFEALEE